MTPTHYELARIAESQSLCVRILPHLCRYTFRWAHQTRAIAVPRIGTVDRARKHVREYETHSNTNWTRITSTPLATHQHHRRRCCSTSKQLYRQIDKTIMFNLEVGACLCLCWMSVVVVWWCCAPNFRAPKKHKHERLPERSSAIILFRNTRVLCYALARVAGHKLHHHSGMWSYTCDVYFVYILETIPNYYL